MRTLIHAALLIVPLCAASPDPVSWKVETPPAKPVKPGSGFRVRLLARIQPGWHVYSMKPIEGGPIPTRLWLPEGQPFQLSGAIQADEPRTIEDPTLQMEVEFYEGQAGFDLPVRVAADAGAGSQKLLVNAAYQSCNNRMCLPPKTVKVEIPVTIAK